MFYYILEEYKNDIYQKSLRNFKDFTIFEKVIIIAIFTCVFLIGLFTYLGLKMDLFRHFIFQIGYGIMYVVFLIVMMIFFIRESEYSKRTNLQSMKAYKEKKIDKLIDLLKKEQIEMYDNKSINWLIEMSDNYVSKHSKDNVFDSIKSYFIMIIYPIICATATIVARNLEVDDVVSIAILLVGVLTQLFAIGFVVYPMVKNFMNRNNIMAETFKEDLQYIVLKMNRE